MPNPIGISFMPSEENQALGPKRGALEGQGGSDLADAFKVLSLRLPEVLGARSLAPKRLLTGAGSSGLPPAFANPDSAIFQALIQSMLGQMPQASPYRDFMDNEGRFPDSLAGDPRVIPGTGQGLPKQSEPAAPPLQSPTPPSMSPRPSGPSWSGGNNRDFTRY
jgi:hypothetical protein